MKCKVINNMILLSAAVQPDHCMKSPNPKPEILSHHTTMLALWLYLIPLLKLIH